ncbi:MAG: sulfonate ABC transporter permease [Gammaproteobacteria bacterium RIFCSPHIGHO2_12_FULL_37_34]|nr:MAG: sulfonate ABC transporter permease [Gammaproteobacteria bacterium RIFCSPHIGHO2_12_FULL_37_34]
MSLFRIKFISATRVRWYPNYWDMIALVLVLAIISLFAFVAKGMTTPYKLGQAIPISLNPAALPFYASRTVVRMLIALFFSLLFTFIFGTWAAKSRHAERIIIPAIDILQAVPILGFLSVTIASFIRLFPGSLLGPECAAVFAIFTSQAWNMAFVFFQTVRSIPADLVETGQMFNLSAWQRFWRIEVPYATPGLLWNTMASMSAGWFFVVAAEAITVSNQDILLPGIGSFIAVAIKAADLRAIGYAVLTMFIVILIYDQLLFRPLVAWAEKFKLEQQATEKSAESWVMNLFRRTRLMRRWGATLGELFDAFVNIKFFRSAEDILFSKSIFQKDSGKWATILWEIGIVLAGILAFIFLWRFVAHHISFTEIRWVLVLGLITTSRVFILILLCSFIWVPLGIWIGLRPHVAQVAQAIAQILSAFPANLLYPFIVMFIVYYHLNPNIWLSPLMILGAQWYILFNIVAGASLIPKELLRVADNLNVTGWTRWRRLLLPSIFPYYVTGAIAAAGGAWNASIVAEVASWGNEKLVATGLGSYITQYTTAGNFPRIALGIGMMCLLVLIINRLIWRPLYVYAENRFVIGVSDV